MSFFSPDKTSLQDGHINVIAEIHAKPDHGAEVKAELMGLVEPSRAEDGCMAYHLLVSKSDTSAFYTYEVWTSEEKLTKHLEGAKERLEKLKPLLACEMKITVLEHLV